MTQAKRIDLKLACELFSKEPSFFKVSSGCMRPLISKGDSVLIKSCKVNELKRGDIVLYRGANNLFVHRFLGIKEDKILTKADMSFKENRPILKEQMIGRVSLVKKGLISLNLESKIFRGLNYLFFIFNRIEAKLYLLVKKT